MPDTSPVQPEAEQPEQPRPDWLIGLDLGKSADYTAAAFLERTAKPDADRPEKLTYHYGCRHLQRWPLGTPYTAIITDLGAMLAQEPLADNCMLAVDQTGVGNAVIELVRAAKLPAKLNPILITSGHTVSRDKSVWHTPKKELASTLVTLLQTGRLKIARLPERDILERELGLFKVKITAAGNETYESWRERDHDDLVLAVAMAAWLGERPVKRFSFHISGGPTLSEARRTFGQWPGQQGG
jgi:hypothetical protein